MRIVHLDQDRWRGHALEYAVEALQVAGAGQQHACAGVFQHVAHLGGPETALTGTVMRPEYMVPMKAMVAWAPLSIRKATRSPGPMPSAASRPANSRERSRRMA